jgi:hypothetical protein
MPENDFLPFATGAGADVLDQADYAAASTGGGFVENGQPSGIFPSVNFNKIARQGSIGTAALAAYIVQQLDVNVIDDGNLSEFVANLTAAIKIGGGRVALTANAQFYVSPSGNDANNGSSGAPWFTLQHAWNAISALYDLAGFTITINLANGTYTTGLFASGALPGQIGSNSIIFNGNSTPSSVTVSTTAGNSCFTANAAFFTVQGMTLTASGGDASCLQSGTQGGIAFSNIDFGSAAYAHIAANNGSIQATGGYSIVGSADYHWVCTAHGLILIVDTAVTVSGTPAFTIFASCVSQSLMEVYGNTYSGSATGKLYDVSQNSVVISGASTFPGNVAGTTETGGEFS